jgi:hypothetical protein
VPYALVCVLVGLVLAWVPAFLHGPIPYKYNVLGIRGGVAVWGWYVARMLIGLLVGITVWPARWYVRGPLCGLLALVPLSVVSLATPGCGPPCAFWNNFTAAAIGLLVAGVAYRVTGRHHA